MRASAAEIARICEQATNALEFYAEKVTKSGARMTPSSTTSISGPGMPDSPRLDLTNSPPRKRMETTENQKTTVNDLLSQDLLQLGLGDIDPTVGAVNQPSIDFSPAVKPATPTNYDELEDIFSKMADKMPVTGECFSPMYIQSDSLFDISVQLILVVHRIHAAQRFSFAC